MAGWWWVLSAAASPLVNPDFDPDLQGWIVREEGGSALPGSVVPDAGTALMQEGDSLLVILEQTFTVPVRPERLSYLLLRDPGFEPLAGGVPDAFEARLLDGSLASVVEPWRVGASSFHNVQQDGTEHHAPDVGIAGDRVSLDISALEPGRSLTLSFVLVNGGQGSLSALRVDDVQILSDNTAPVAVVAPVGAIECGQSITLDASASSDADGDAVSWQWQDPAGIPISDDSTVEVQPASAGPQTYTVVVTDIVGDSDTEEVVVEVTDTLPPMLVVPAPPVVTVDALCMAELPDLTTQTDATDTCGAPLVTQTPAAGEDLFLGTPVLVTLVATDSGGNAVQDTVLVTPTDPAGLCSLDTADSGIVDTDVGPVRTPTADTSPEPDTPIIDTEVPEDTDGTTDTDLIDANTGDDKPPRDCSCASGGPAPSGLMLAFLLIFGRLRRRSGRGPRYRAHPLGWVWCMVLLAASMSSSTAQAAGPLTDGVPADGTLSGAGTTEIWTWQAPEGQSVWLDAITSTNASYGAWHIEDAVGRIVASNSRFTDIDRVHLMGGSYQVVVTSLREDDYTYSFTVYDSPSRDFTGALDTPIVGTLAAPGEQHLYAFDAPAGARVSVDSAANTSHGLWRIHDAQGRVVAAADSLTDSLPIGLMGGAYVLEVSSRNGGIGDYDLTLATVVDRGPAAITIGTPFDGELAPGDTDRWVLTPTSPMRVNLQLLASSAANGLNWSLYDARGTVVRSRSTTLSTTGPIRLAAAPYTLEITAEPGVTATYEMLAHTVVDITASVAMGDTTTLTFDTPGQIAELSFQAQPGDRFFFDNPTFDSAYGWSLRDALGGERRELTTNLQWPEVTLLDGGEYILTVDPEGDTTGSIDVMLRPFLDSETSTALGATVAGTITRGEQQRHTFDAAPGDTLELSVISTDNPFGLNMRLQDSVGRILVDTTSLGDQPPLALVGGSYTLTVVAESGGIGSYEIALLDGGPSTYTPPVGTAFDVDTDVVGTLASVAAPDLWTLTLPVDAQVSFDMVVPGDRLEWRLVDGVGVTVFDGIARQSSNDHLALELLAGTYTVEFTGSELVDYTFRVHTTPPPLEVSAALGDTLTNTLTVPGELHRYAFSVATPTVVYIDPQQTFRGLVWTLHDGITTRLLPGNTTILGAGDYVLEVGSDRDDVGPYALGLTPVVEQSTPITYDQQVDALLPNPATTHHYLFDAADGDRIFFDTDGASGTLEWVLRDPEGERRFDASARTDTLDQGPLELYAGTWSLEVSTTSTEATYGFTLVRAGGASEPAQLDTEFSGMLTVGGPHDHLIELTEPTRVFLDLTLGGSGMLMSLLDEAGEIIGEPVRADNTTADDGDPITLAAGVYTVRFESEAGATPAYAAALRSTVDTETTLEVGERVRSEMQAPGSVDTYVFEVLADGLVVGATLQEGEQGLFWAMTDEVDQPVYPRQRARDRNTDDLAPLALRAGTYTLELNRDDDQVSDYAFRLGSSVDEVGGFCDALGQPGTADCDGDGITDACAVADGLAPDCNTNFVPDACELASETDCDANGLPDDCYICNPIEVVFVVDTSASMGDEATGLCNNIDAAVAALSNSGIATDLHVYGIESAQASFPCLTAGSLEVYGEELPLEPPAALGDLVCGTSSGNNEDWGRAVARAAAFHPWRPNVGRVVIPISDEGPFCGSPLTPEDDIALDFAITAARAFDVQVHPIAGTGTTADLRAYMDRIADATGGFTQQSTSASEEFLDFLQEISEEVCTDLFDCDRDGTPDSCQFAAGERVECACGRVPDICDCAGPPTLQVDIDDGTSLPTGVPITVSGRATTTEPDTSVAAVLVNGRAVNSVDVTGRWFATVELEPGATTLSIEAIDRCGTAVVQLDLFGDDAGAAEGLQRIAQDLRGLFTDTTWSTDRRELLVDVSLVNDDALPIAGPVMMGFGPEFHPTAELLTLDRFSPDGKPLVQMLAAGEILEPGAQTGPRALRIAVPDGEPPHIRDVWYAARPAVPSFTTSPTAWVRAEQTWRYEPAAYHPADRALTWQLPVAPEGMAFDATTGALSWTPLASDLGLHDIALTVSDGLGGTAEQRFVLEVRGAADNAAPVFTQAPPSFALVGASFAYTVAAIDPDGDPLTYALQNGPPGLTLDPTTGQMDWTPPGPGAVELSVTVSDDRGASVSQSWTLTVGDVAPSEGGPRILSSPASGTVVGDLYLYQPSALDPDGDVLSWRLLQAPPSATIDPVLGRVRWAAAPGDVGEADFHIEVSDGDATATQAWTLSIVADPANRPPVFVSRPGAQAVAGQVWTYAVQADDPEGEPVTYAVSGPTGMQVQDGVLTWTPSAAGEHTVRVIASDPSQVSAEQSFTLAVRGNNRPPVIGTVLLPSATVGERWAAALSASDADDDVLSWSLLEAPTGMTQSAWSGGLVWQPTGADLGAHPVRVSVDDGYGGRATASFTLDVVADTEPPVVSLSIGRTPACVDEPVVVCVGAADAVGIAERTLSFDGVLPPLDARGCAESIPHTVGPLPLVATATDGAGNTGEADQSLLVVDCNDTQAPVVTLTAPALGSVVHAPTEIVVSIDDNTPAALSWVVEQSPHGVDRWTTLTTGTGAVDEAAVAWFDPTLLPNDDYDLRVLAEDGAQSGGIQWTVGVGGDLKVGNFAVTFTDLTVDLVGIPITITRTYDSLDTSSRDFGPGWSMGLSGAVWDTPVEDETGNPLAIMLNESFRNDSRVYVVKPTGERVGFTFAPEPLSYPAAFQNQVIFEPDPGVTDTLEAVGPPVVWNFGAGYADYIIPYNPDQYVLITPQGVRYTYDETDGLILVEDAYGNTITVTPDGLEHSSGDRVDIERDAEGRITRILEPDPDPNDGIAPPALNYDYDTDGRLVAMRNQLDHASTYGYDIAALPFHLTTILDGEGRPVTRTAYDDDGRVVAQCPADGDLVTLEGCDTFVHDVTGGLTTTVDARGFRTDFFFDAAGEVTLERRYMGPSELLDIERTYDDRGNMLSETIEGQTWTFAFDDQDRRLFDRDPEGRTRSYTYGECDGPLTRSYPRGGTEVFEYDEDCYTRSFTDTLGNTVTYLRNEDGNVTHVIDEMGESWVWTFNDRGQYIHRQSPSGDVESFEWDDDGQLLSSTGRDGRTVSFERDLAGRIVRETWDTGEVTTFTWDRGDKLSQASSPDVTLDFTYHPTGLPNEATTTGTGLTTVTTTTQWNGAAKVASVEDSLGGTTTYEWDALRRLIEIGQSGAGVSTKQVHLSWSPNSRLERVERQLDGTLGVQTDLTYDSGGDVYRLSEIAHQTSAGSPIHVLQFDRDAHGDIQRMVDAEGEHTYVHDSRRFLLSADHDPTAPVADEQWQWNPAGNATRFPGTPSATYANDSPGGTGHQLVSDGQHDWDYDGAGRAIRRTHRSSGDVLEMDWDPRGRLVELRSIVGGTTERTRYTYDPLDRAVAITVDGVRTQQVWDRRNHILTLDDSGVVLHRRLMGDGLDEIYAEETAAGTRWLLTDHQGSVRDAVDNTGAVQSHHAYSSFGVAVADAPDSAGFTGATPMGVDGWYALRARIYDANTGRFLSQDPLGPFGYGYGAGNPTFHRDPTGESVAVEYACLAHNAVFFGISAGQNIGAPVAAIFKAVAEAFDGIKPPDDLAGGVGGGLLSFGAGAMGPAGWIVSPPSNSWDIPNEILKGGCAGAGG